ncbi:MAG: hypothetical protein RIC85_05355 [Gammaproteobacteria bacterium]|uniref:hypothetical protein n=1 Tax=Thalassobaculum sp. TaxID=2022740 RepID=UPI0032EB9A4F
MPHETAALTAHALLALGERLGRAGATPSRPRDQVHSAKRLINDGTLRDWMARERRVVPAVVAGIVVTIDPVSPRLQRFDVLGSKLPGFTVEGSRVHTTVGWRALLATADEVRRRPRRLRMHSIAHSPAAIALKRVAVVDRISGPAVAAALPAPFGPGGELAATSGGRTA